VLSIAGIHLNRVIGTIRNWNFLAEVLSFTPAYLAISGLVWLLSGLPLAWGLWRGRAWARPLTLLAAWVYSLYFWLDRLLLRSPAATVNQAFALGGTILFLLVVHWILSSHKARKFFNL